MVGVAPTEEDVYRMLAAMRPPTIPDEVFTVEYPDVMACRRWHKGTAAALLGGLQTDAQFHANGVRLDWLLRLVLSKANGIRKPTRYELSGVLNAAFDKARVLRLEDPNEDLFCELIVSKRGDFRIFAGQWESAGAYTQTLLEAFESLPDAKIKSAALASVYALLRLSEEVASRAGVDREMAPSGTPSATIELPSPLGLRHLADRVKFTCVELTKLGIRDETLTPYILASHQFADVSSQPIGDTPLEFRPLLRTPAATVLVSPQNVSTAIRATLIMGALRGGMGDAFQQAILNRQERWIDQGQFWPVSPISLPPADRFLMRTIVRQHEPGRYLQVIQVPDVFGDFPRSAFASVRPLSSEATRSLASLIEGFWDFTKKQEDVRSTATVVVVSGWGGLQEVIPAINDDKAPPNWQFLAASFADLLVMGVVPDMKLDDVLRVLRQRDRLAADGFEFQNLSGALNLLGFWKSTGGNLIPDHILEMRPPTVIMLPTDSLLALRIDCARRRDCRTLPLPGGGATLVERMERSDKEELQSVYVSPSDVEARRFSSAVVNAGRVWWLDFGTAPQKDWEWLYRCMNASLQWIEAVGQKVAEQFPIAFPIGVRRVCVGVPSATELGRILDSEIFGTPIIDTLAIKQTLEGGIVEVLPGWLPYLSLRENVAEVALLAAIFKCLSLPGKQEPSFADLLDILLRAVGSADWRWLHLLHTDRIEDRLAAAGPTRPFRAVPYSAHTLVKCGSVWNFRDRSLGGEMEGKQECLTFIRQYVDEMLRSLIADIRRFSRVALCVMSAECHQGARAEQTLWRHTIRAMRAIHRSPGDVDALKRHSEINAVLRAAKIICEIAACEASVSDERQPSRIEVDEMFAKALLIFGNSQLYCAITTDLIPAKIRISPAGDLMTERDVLTNILSPGVEWVTRKRFDEAAAAYAIREKTEDPQQQPLDIALRRALEAEYGISVEGFFDLQYAVAELVEEHKQPVMVVLRSELAKWLAGNSRFRCREPVALLERLTLPARGDWFDLSSGIRSTDIDFGKFDRPWSIINRPLLALDNTTDPDLVLSPLLVADAFQYCLWGLTEGSLNDRYWVSAEARGFAGAQGNASGAAFEDELAARLRALGLEVIPRCKLSSVLNQKVPDELGDIDALAITPDRKRVRVIEAKNLRLCRSEAEAASRMFEYRGNLVTDERGRQRPDKMLRHLRRVGYLRRYKDRLVARLTLPESPEVLGLVIVESPQPMNFHAAKSDPDARSVFLDSIGEFSFFERQ
jgi:hypothetical protein